MSPVVKPLPKLAVIDHGHKTTIYMNRDGILTSYIGTTDNDDFDEKQIQIHDEDVECDFDQEIAAVALGDGESRLYFTKKNQLKELMWSGSKDTWSYGSLTDKFSLEPGSDLTCTIKTRGETAQDPQNDPDLGVYGRMKGADVTTEFYYHPTEDWQYRPIFTVS